MAINFVELNHTGFDFFSQNAYFAGDFKIINDKLLFVNRIENYDTMIISYYQINEDNSLTLLSSLTESSEFVQTFSITILDSSHIITTGRRVNSGKTELRCYEIISNTLTFKSSILNLEHSTNMTEPQTIKIDNNHLAHIYKEDSGTYLKVYSLDANHTLSILGTKRNIFPYNPSGGLDGLYISDKKIIVGTSKSYYHYLLLMNFDEDYTENIVFELALPGGTCRGFNFLHINSSTFAVSRTKSQATIDICTFNENSITLENSINISGSANSFDYQSALCNFNSTSYVVLYVNLNGLSAVTLALCEYDSSYNQKLKKESARDSSSWVRLQSTSESGKFYAFTAHGLYLYGVEEIIIENKSNGGMISFNF